jgi:glycosyltransferase involved in cell wall biosynthesis
MDVKLDLVGTGDGRAANKTQVLQLGLENRVRFLGYVPREKIAEHYAAADVFVLPSFNEGMSVALLEAMASGLAVVVTPTGGTAELVEQEVNGLIFEWADVAALTAHLRRLASDRSLLSRMGDASRRRAEEFSWDRAALCYVELLNRLTDIAPQADTNLGAEAKHKA